MARYELYGTECIGLFVSSLEKQIKFKLIQLTVDKSIYDLAYAVNTLARVSKRNRLKSALWKTRKELDLLLIPFMGSGESESAAQQSVNRELKPMRGRAQALQKAGKFSP